ncbi:MAG: hypothetical protein AAGA87_08015, partial [Pseudomonadota bacterium]
MKSMIAGCILAGSFTGAAIADERTVYTRLLCTDNAAILQVARSTNQQPVFEEIPAPFATSLADAEDVPSLECNLASQPMRI